jgi:hypothetical protein
MGRIVLIHLYARRPGDEIKAEIMISKKNISLLRQKLLQRRSEILDRCRTIDASWQALHEPGYEKTDEEIAMDGEDEEIDVHDSLSNRKPMTPPDDLTPEKR